MDKRFSRAKIIYGEGLEALASKRVAVFGIGGVGSFAAEALARSGVGAIDIIDSDTVDITNINRQLYALSSTVGRYKVEVARERIVDISPECKVTAHRLFYGGETADLLPIEEYDYIIDAIDSVTSKLLLIERAQAAGVPIICSMGTGNKTDPTRLELADIYSTSVCPLARVMRHELKKRGIKGLTVLYSREEPVKPKAAEEAPQNGRRAVPGSTAFVPPAAGLIIAGRVINELIGANR
ncbi:MAG: tRNA threonylcarbamoyladenosine dehydratase [Ruminococcus sp.]|nr:tRNA threonylcarbamoyladenosine dehydratase [Ruminococcus sp.]